MAEAGVYLCVVRQDGELPQVVHSSIRKDDDQGREEAMSLAWNLFQSARGRIPFTVAELHLSPAISNASEFKHPDPTETVARSQRARDAVQTEGAD